MRAVHTRVKAGKLAVGFPSKRDEAVINQGGIRSESMLYDFSSDTGAVGTYLSNRKIPAGAIVTQIVADEITTLTSGGSATVQVKAGSTNLTDALAFDTGFNATTTIALASSATAIKVVADSEISIAIAAAALTAGKLRIHIAYRLPTDGRS